MAFPFSSPQYTRPGDPGASRPIKTDSHTLGANLGEMASCLPPPVLVDVDETVLDNSSGLAHQVQAGLRLAKEQAPPTSDTFAVHLGVYPDF